MGDGPLTFNIDLIDCGVGGWNPETSSFLLHSHPLTSSHLLLIPPSYSTLLPNLLLTPPTSSQRVSDVPKVSKVPVVSKVAVVPSVPSVSVVSNVVVPKHDDIKKK